MRYRIKSVSLRKCLGSDAVVDRRGLSWLWTYTMRWDTTSPQGIDYADVSCALEFNSLFIEVFIGLFFWSLKRTRQERLSPRRLSDSFALGRNRLRS